MKKIISAFVVIAMIFSLAGTIGASAAEVTVFVDGEQVAFDQAPVIENGRTLVPVRAIAEKLGADVSWDEATRTATIIKGGNVVAMTIDVNVIKKNGFEIEIDQPPVIRGGRTLIPARALAESLDCKVDWDAEKYRVDVTTITDKAFDSVKDFLVKEGAVVDDGYAIAFYASELFSNEEYGDEVMYLGYNAVENNLIFGYIYEESQNSALVYIGRGEDTFEMVIVEMGAYYDITEILPKTLVKKEGTTGIKMATNNISAAYGIEQSVVEEFANQAAEMVFLDVDALLYVAGIDVTVEDLGFTNYK